MRCLFFLFFLFFLLSFSLFFFDEITGTYSKVMMMRILKDGTERDYLGGLIDR